MKMLRKDAHSREEEICRKKCHASMMHDVATAHCRRQLCTSCGSMKCQGGILCHISMHSG